MAKNTVNKNSYNKKSGKSSAQPPLNTTTSEHCEKCFICDNALEKDACSLHCDHYHRVLHGICWDPDITTEI